MSLCQDIICTVKRSRVKTPKHIGLAMSIKHLTGSKQVVHILNSQGHCISYDDLCNIVSAIASETLQLAEASRGVYIPSNIIPVSNGRVRRKDLNESFALMEELGNNADFPDTLTEV